MPDVITHADQVEPAWLSQILRAQGVLDRGHVTTIQAHELEMPGSSTKFLLDITYSVEAPRSAPQRLFLKLSRPDLADILPLAGQKEVLFYNSISADMDRLPLVRCYDAMYDPNARRYHILLEDLSASHVAVPGTIMPPQRPHCYQMVDTLAQLHAYWWDHPRLGADIGALPSQDSVKSVS